MGWLRLVSSIKLQVSFAKEPYKRDYILQKRPVILSILLPVATPCARMQELEKESERKSEIAREHARVCFWLYVCV